MNSRFQASQSSVWLRFPAFLLMALIVVTWALAPLQSASAQTFRVIHAFSPHDGADPYGGLLRDSAGNLYGTTGYGGSAACDGFGCGVTFKLDSAGKETILLRFNSQATGIIPTAGLIADSAGNFYGTTGAGGNSQCGCGTVFRLDSAGHETVLYSFQGGNDGSNAEAALLRDAAGHLYGTTFRGGGKANSGTVFKLDPSGKETVLYRFTGKTDGMWPQGALIEDAQGNLYGATELGGDLSGCGGSGCGVVFRINASGGETVLYTFKGGTTDGYDAIAGLVRDAAGNLFGTTYRGGAFGVGTVFRLDAEGRESLVHNFSGGSDGLVS